MRNTGDWATDGQHGTLTKLLQAVVTWAICKLTDTESETDKTMASWQAGMRHLM